MSLQESGEIQRLCAVVDELYQSKKYEVRAAQLPAGTNKDHSRANDGGVPRTVEYNGQLFHLSDFIGSSPKHVDGPEFRRNFPVLLEIEQTCKLGRIQLRVLGIQTESGQNVVDIRSKIRDTATPTQSYREVCG